MKCPHFHYRGLLIMDARRVLTMLHREASTTHLPIYIYRGAVLCFGAILSERCGRSPSGHEYIDIVRQ